MSDSTTPVRETYDGGACGEVEEDTVPGRVVTSTEGQDKGNGSVGEKKDDSNISASTVPQASAKELIGEFCQFRTTFSSLESPSLTPKIIDNVDPGWESSPSSSQLSDTINAVKRLHGETSQTASGKRVKDLDSHKFWKTQPIVRFDETFQHNAEGLVRAPDIESIPTSPPALAIEGYEWVTVDLTNDTEMNEIYKLLKDHYVEDDEGMLRFRYPKAMLKW